MRKAMLALLCFVMAIGQLWAQTRTVSGKVEDASGNPMVGATVAVKGTDLRSLTNATGDFSIYNVPSSARTLAITSVGFQSIEVAISSLANGAVKMAASTADLDEVVVTGYTREKKSQFAGAAAILSGKVVESVPVGAFDQALQGRAAGVQVQSGSGQPGSSASVTIRGISSIQASGAQPLYVIDGVPATAQDMQAINANDFESITVLKDANAAALYGSRGALGVIVITTKKGKAGATQFTFRSQFGFTQKANVTNFDMMNSQQVLQYEEALGLQGLGISGPGWVYSSKNPAYANLSPATQARYTFLRDSFNNQYSDWSDILFRQGTSQNYELNMQGGSDRTRFFSSVSIFDQQGTDLRSRLKRYTGRFNLDHTSNKVSVQWNTQIGYAITNFNEGDFRGNSALNPFQMSWRAKPYENPYGGPNGALIFGSSTTLNPRAIGNVIESINNSIWDEHQLKMISGLTIAYRILPYLTAKNTLGIDAAFERAQRAINPASYIGSLQTFNSGFNSQSSRTRSQLINTTSLVFNKSFGLHDVEVGGYFEAIRSWTSAFGYQIWNLDPRLGYAAQGAGTLPVTGSTIPQYGSGAKSGFGIRSYFATAKYVYNDKYAINGNIRRDGTSRILNDANNEITSYSIGAIWDAGKEDFIQGLGFFNDLRLRASYGSVPNIGSITSNSYGISGGLYGVPNYLGPQLPTFATTTGFAGSTITGIVPSTPGNPDLRIEYVVKTNIGIDMSFWNSRVKLSVDAYNNETRDLFVNQPLGATTGFGGTSLPINAGTMQNKGIEFVLGFDIIRTRNSTLTFNWNHSINKNKITDLGLVDEYQLGTYIIRKGLPFGSHYTYDYLGADPATGQPRYRTADGKETFDIAKAGQFADFGTYLPKHVGGFGLDYTLGRFTASAFFSYQTDVSRYNNIWNWITRGTPGYLNAVNQNVLMLTEQWTKPGDDKYYQAAKYDRGFTAADIQDAKFLRFRNLNVGYNLGGIDAGGKKLISGAKFYVQVQNLYIWSPWKGPDPEDNNNISLNEFPNPRMMVAGLDINF